MDPNACFRDVMIAIEDNDLPEAYSRLRDLQGWIDKGGFVGDHDEEIVPALRRLVEDAARWRKVKLIEQQELF